MTPSISPRPFIKNGKNNKTLFKLVEFFLHFWANQIATASHQQETCHSHSSRKGGVVDNYTIYDLNSGPFVASLTLYDAIKFTNLTSLLTIVRITKHFLNSQKSFYTSISHQITPRYGFLDQSSSRIFVTVQLPDNSEPIQLQACLE